MRGLMLCLFMIFPTPVAAHDLISSGTAVAVARSDLTVTPNMDWNKLNVRAGRNSETWTLDGELLNNLSYYGGVQNDRPIFNEIDRRNRPLPRFQSTMLPSDIPVLFESSYRIARGAAIFSIDSQEPTTFAGASGVRFTYSFVDSDDIRRQGEAQGSIVGGKLYLIAFEAPAIHFFAQGVDAYRSIAATAQIVASGRHR